jgi:hypothetical protein
MDEQRRMAVRTWTWPKLGQMSEFQLVVTNWSYSVLDSRLRYNSVVQEPTEMDQCGVCNRNGGDGDGQVGLQHGLWMLSATPREMLNGVMESEVIESFCLGFPSPPAAEK